MTIATRPAKMSADRTTTSPLLKRALIPLWSLQILVLLIYIGVIAYFEIQVGSFYGYDISALFCMAYKQGSTELKMIRSPTTLLSVSAVCVAADFGEIIAFTIQKLPVWAYFRLQLSKAMIWFALLIVGIVNTIRVQTSRGYGPGYSSPSPFVSYGLIVLIVIL